MLDTVPSYICSIKSKDTALGKLMSDFYCTEAKEMNFEELSERVRQFKETEEGVDSMCDVWDEVRKEGEIKARIDNANSMLKKGALTLEEVAEYSGLSLEKVRELAGNKSA